MLARRVWRALVDILDGILGAVLYGNQGGLTYTTTTLESQNQDKLRQWSAGSSETPTSAEDKPTETDVDTRIRKFRAETNKLGEN